MDSRHRFSQSKDPFAQSVLFGSGNSPQIAPSVSPSHQTMSPMQSMDGVSTVRSPYQGRRFGSDSGQKSTYLAGTRSHTKRPPLSSVLDERMTSAEFPLISSARLERGLLAPIGGIGTGGIGGGGGVGTPSSSTPMGSTSMGGGLGSVSGGGIGMSGRGLNGAQGGLNGLSGGMNGSGGGGGGTAERELFMSPAPERGSYGGASFFHTQSPMLQLGAYAPSMDRLEAAWCSWVVVSGFYPSPQNQESVLQQFMQCGDIENHHFTHGNWLFIKYVNPIAAERASHRHGSFLNADTLLSVLVLTARLASNMNLQMARDGSLIVGGGGRGGGSAGGGGGIVRTMGSVGSVSEEGEDVGLGLRQRESTGTEMARNREEARLASGRYRVPEGEEGGQGLYLQPHRRKSLCERLVEYFFSY